MPLLPNITDGLRSLFRKEQVCQELDEELDGFLEMAVEEKMKHGMSRADALRAVRLERGNLEVAKEVVGLAGWESHVETLWQDLRFGLRMFRKNPGFTAVALFTLALGLGASTAIFSVVDAVLLRPLPYPNPQQIIRLWEQAPDGHRMSLADPNFEDFRAQNHTLSGLALYNDGPESVSGGSEPARIDVAGVTQDFFTALGVEPFRGRPFAADEQVFHGAPAMIVSYGYWQQFLGSATDLSHVRLTMDGVVYPVIGVMPRRFSFPPGAAAWVPREFLYGVSASRTAHGPACLGRLRDGVTVDAGPRRSGCDRPPNQKSVWERSGPHGRCPSAFCRRYGWRCAHSSSSAIGSRMPTAYGCLRERGWLAIGAHFRALPRTGGARGTGRWPWAFDSAVHR